MAYIYVGEVPLEELDVPFQGPLPDWDFVQTSITWNTAPVCGTQGLVVSPNYCDMPPTVDIPAVPLPNTLLLLASAFAVLIGAKRKQPR
jgi:hypothetical protein